MGGIGSFPDSYHDVPTEFLLQVYVAGPERLRRALDGISDGDLRAKIVPGKWSILEIALHVADSELMGAARIRMLLGSTPRKEAVLLPGYDQDEWSRELSYDSAATDQVEHALVLLSALRAATTPLFPAPAAPDWQRTAVHPESGTVTLRNLLELYADHTERHLEQILDRRRRLGTPIEVQELLPRRLY